MRLLTAAQLPQAAHNTSKCLHIRNIVHLAAKTSGDDSERPLVANP